MPICLYIYTYTLMKLSRQIFICFQDNYLLRNFLELHSNEFVLPSLYYESQAVGDEQAESH